MIKQTLLRFALLLFCTASFLGSEAQRFYWANTDASSNFFTSSIRAIEIDSEDNVIAFGILGDRYITASQDLYLDSAYNYFIAKFDPTGELIWLEPIGSSGYLSTTDNQIGLALDSDDNIYVSAPIQVSRSLNFQGTIVSYGGSGSGSDTDVFLAKYDADANLDFVINQNADDSYPNALSVDKAGNIYLAGTFNGELILDQTLTSAGGSDAYIAMYDQSGNPQWSHQRGNSITDDSFDIKCDGTAIYWGTNIKTGIAPAQFHTVIEKFNSAGLSVWSYTISASDDGQSLNGSALHVDDNSVYITGDFRVSIEFPTAAANFVLSTTPSNLQTYVSKLSDAGPTVNFNWAVQRGSTLGSDFSFDVNKTLGRVFLLKRTSTDFQIERLSDTDGSFESSLSPDHPAVSYTYGYSLSINSTNDIYIGGYHTGNLGFGDEIKSSRGLFLIKTQETLGGVDWISAPLQYKKEIQTSTHDAYGNMYIAGYMNGEFKDDPVLRGKGSSEIFIQKYSAVGDLLYTRMHTSLFSDEVAQIKVSGEHLYVAGTFDAYDGSSLLSLDESTTLSGEEDKEVYLTKYDLNGNLIWAINAASAEGDITVSDMAIDTSGNIYLHGDALGGSPKDFGNGVTRGFDDVGSFLAKYDANGLTQWVNIIEGTKSDAIEVVGGQVIIAGRFEENIDFEGNALVVNGTNDIYLASYSLDGAFQWVREAGGDSQEYITGVRADEEVGIFMSGYYRDDFAIDTESLIGERREGFVAKYGTDGSFDWVSGGGGPRDDYFYSLDIDTAGNPYVIGKYEGSAIFGSLSFNGIGDRDIQALLIGYDESSGDEIYSAEFGYPTDYIEGDDDDYFNSISIDQNNDYYLTGDFIDEVALDTILIPDDGNNTFFATKMSLSDCAYLGEVAFDVDGSFCSGEVISFTDNSELGAHEITSWTWDFGDGTSSNDQHPDHRYSNGGSYEVTLIVNYFGGACELRTSETLTVKDSQSVSAGDDIEVCREAPVTLSGSMSGSTTTILWTTLGDGLFDDQTRPTATYEAGLNDLSSGFVELVISSNNAGCVIARDTVVVNIRDEVVVSAGEDLSVCFDQMVNLEGSYTGTSSIQWTALGDGVFTDPLLGSTGYTPGPTDLINREVEVVLSSTNDECQIARDTVVINIRDEVVVSAGEDLSVCFDQMVNLEGSYTGTSSIQWTALGDGVFTDPLLGSTGYTPGPTDLINREVEVVLSSTNDECQIARDTVVINIRDEVVVSAGEDLSVCFDQMVNLEGSYTGTSSIQWTALGDGVFTDPLLGSTGYTPGPTDLINREVEVVLSSTNDECQIARDTVVINIRDEVVVSAGEDLSVCFDQMVNLEGSYTGTSSIQWTALGDGVFTDPLLGSTGYTPGPTDLINREVEVVLSSTNDECQIARDTVTINIYEELRIDAGDDQAICPGEQITLTPIVFGSESIQWTTNGDGVFENPNAMMASYTPGVNDLNDGSVELTITTLNNKCEEIFDTMTISIFSTKEAEDYLLELEEGEVSQQILTSEELEAGFTILIESDPSYGDATIENGNINYSLKDPSVSADSFLYSIQTPCSNDVGQVDVINVLGGIEVYNVVTPNGDGHHDFLRIKNIVSYPDNTIQIFDRLGKIVFTTDGYSDNNSFNGLSNRGKELPDGNYFYRLTIPKLELDQSGFILLKR